MRWIRALALLAPLAGCGTAQPGVTTCGPADAQVENASRLTVEQFYLARAGEAGWGADLLGPGGLPSRASLPIRFAGTGQYRLRVVWVNGQAMEMRGVDGCLARRITILDGGMRAE